MSDQGNTVGEVKAASDFVRATVEADGKLGRFGARW